MSGKSELLVVGELSSDSLLVLIHLIYDYMVSLLVKAIPKLVFYSSQEDPFGIQLVNSVKDIGRLDVHVSIHVKTKFVFRQDIVWLKFGISG
jgi:hypothetical protein